MVTRILAALLILAPGAWAATVPAASCSTTHINTATGNAATGDTVTVPGGSCTWTSQLNTWPGKNLILQGAGAGVTNITINTGGNNAIQLGTTASRVTGFTFIWTSGSNNFIYARGQGFRVDHCDFTQTGTSGLIAVSIDGASGASIPHPTGLVDHCYFYRMKVIVQGNLNNKAEQIWYDATTIGNADQTGVVYVEDCIFDRTGTSGVSDDVVDATAGGRYVFRYNTVTNGVADVHGTQQSPTRFAGKSAEIYSNTFHSTETRTRAIQLRAGTAVVYNNTMTGNYINFCDVDNQRSYTLMSYPPDDCNGTSDFDGNDVGQNGYPCRDQPGRGSDATLWDGTTYPIPAQALEPMYFWGNTDNGSPVGANIINCTSAVKTNGSCADIVLDRDYYHSARPGYTAYTYPHPLNTDAAPATGSPSMRMRGAAEQDRRLNERVAWMLAALGWRSAR